jgi:hypothetical protein
VADHEPSAPPSPVPPADPERHHTGQYRAVTASQAERIALLAAVSLLYCGAGCVSTPAGLRLTQPAAKVLDGIESALCPLEAIVDLAAACPGEDAAFATVIGSVTAPSTASSSGGGSALQDAGAPLVALYRRGAKGEPPLVQIGAVSGARADLPELRRRALAIVGPLVRDAGAGG